MKTVLELQKFLNDHADDDLIDVGLMRLESGFYNIQLQVCAAEDNDILDVIDLVDTYVLPTG